MRGLGGRWVVLVAVAGALTLWISAVAASKPPGYATNPIGGSARSSLPNAAGSGCKVPLPPGSIRSRSQPGHWFNRRSPFQIGLYYLAAVFARHYRILAGGFGGSFGPNGGSGFGFQAHSKRCGYFAVGGGGKNRHGTQFQVCAGKTAAALKRCSNSNKPRPRPPFTG